MIRERLLWGLPICRGPAFRVLLDCLGVANLQGELFSECYYGETVVALPIWKDLAFRLPLWSATIETLRGGCQFVGLLFEITLRLLWRDGTGDWQPACFSDVANLLRSAFKTLILLLWILRWPLPLAANCFPVSYCSTMLWSLPICTCLAAPLLLLGVANLPLFGQTMAPGKEYEIWQEIVCAPPWLEQNWLFYYFHISLERAATCIY